MRKYFRFIIDKIIFISIENGHLIFYRKDAGTQCLRFDGLDKIQHVPFYHQLWDKDKLCGKTFKLFLKKTFHLSIFSRPKLFVIVPDDASTLETSAIASFFSQFANASTITCSMIGEMLSDFEMSSGYGFISLTKSERNIVLKYFKGADSPIIKRYFSVDFTDVTVIERAINELANYDKIPPVFLYGENMKDFSVIGHLLSTSEMFESAISNITAFNRRRITNKRP